MPVLSWAHGRFWSGVSGGGNINPPLGVAGASGYAPWMTTVTVCSMLFLATRSWAPR
jgi:hypothetical protein